MMRQDEIETIVHILNALSIEISGGTLVIPNHYQSAKSILQSLDWTKNDMPPKALDRSVISSLFYKFLSIDYNIFRIGLEVIPWLDDFGAIVNRILSKSVWFFIITRSTGCFFARVILALRLFLAMIHFQSMEEGLMLALFILLPNSLIQLMVILWYDCYFSKGLSLIKYIASKDNSQGLYCECT